MCGYPRVRTWDDEILGLHGGVVESIFDDDGEKRAKSYVGQDKQFVSLINHHFSTVFTSHTKDACKWTGV